MFVKPPPKEIEQKIEAKCSLLGISKTYLIIALEFLSRKEEIGDQDFDYEILDHFIERGFAIEFKRHSDNLRSANDTKRKNSQYAYSNLSEGEYTALAVQMSPMAFALLNDIEHPKKYQAAIIDWAVKEHETGRVKNKPLNLTSSIINNCQNELNYFIEKHKSKSWDL